MITFDDIKKLQEEKLDFDLKTSRSRSLGIIEQNNKDHKNRYDVMINAKKLAEKNLPYQLEKIHQKISEKIKEDIQSRQITYGIKLEDNMSFSSLTYDCYSTFSISFLVNILQIQGFVCYINFGNNYDTVSIIVSW